jgi:hypothetical protein
MAKKRRLKLRKKNKAQPRTLTGNVSKTDKILDTASKVAPIVGAAGGLVDTLFDDEVVPGKTKEDIEFASDRVDDIYDVAGDKLDDPMNVYRSTRGLSGPSKSESAESALAEYYASKGFSPEEAAAKAAQKAAQVAGNDKKKLGDIKGFKKFLRQQGSDYGFSVKDGRIKYDEGDFVSGGERDVLTDPQVGFTEDILEASSGLLPEFTQDAQSGLDYRRRVRDILGGQALDSGMDDLLAADIDQLQDISKDINRSTFSELQDTGFLSSSIAPKAFADATTKGLRSNLLQMQKNRAGLRSQNIRDILASESQLGGPSTIGQFQSGAFVSPTQYGGVTDYQAGSLAQKEAELRSNVERDRANNQGRILTEDYLY